MTEISPTWGFTCLPPEIRVLFKGMPGSWRHRHHLVFCWLIIMQIVTSGARLMLGHFQPPAWARMVIVVGDAAFAAKENMKLVQARDKADPQRRWGFVFAIARTWNMEN